MSGARRMAVGTVGMAHRRKAAATTTPVVLPVGHARAVSMGAPRAMAGLTAALAVGRAVVAPAHAKNA